MVCPTCASEFVPTNKQQKFCTPNCRKAVSRHTARDQRRLTTAETEFVGVDGEGYTDALGLHHYTMLSVGDNTLAQHDHLDFLTIMEFLWENFEERPKAAYVGFFLGYDFTAWFRTLPEDRAKQLFDASGRRRTLSGGNTVPFPVRYEGWEFDILGMKRFKLRKEGAKNWMYVNDAGPFFATSFMAAIDPKGWPDGPVVTDDEWSIINEGKSHRADEYTRDSWWAAMPDLTRYNITENLVLARMMSRYEQGLIDVGVHLSRDQWYGPGAAANAYLNNAGTMTGEELRAQIPEEAMDFARQSYYGGWFEVFAHGIIPGTSWEADITSAYPHAMSEMPDWASCTYEWVTEMPGYGLVDCTVTGSDPIVGAMLHRRSDGTILRPSRTRGVYWSFELRMAEAAGLIDTIEVHRALEIRESGLQQPLTTEVPSLFQRRKQVGKNTPTGKAVKLVLNSLYGKQAQSIGSPKHSSPLAASFITAHCRTAILFALALQEGGTDDLVMVATDGIYFRNRPTELNEGSMLGEWEVAAKENLTIVMPGVHYDDKSREGARRGDLSKLRTRGISAQGFANSIEELDRQFERLVHDPTDPDHWPAMSVPIKFKVMSPKLAIHQGNWDQAGTVERDIERNLSTNPKSKRRPPTGAGQGLLDIGYDFEPYVVGGIVRTHPYPQARSLESTPYNKFFGGPVSDGLHDFGDGPDGPLMFQFRELMEGSE